MEETTVRAYNESLADEYFNKFTEINGDLNLSKDEMSCAKRSLIYNVFRRHCGMSDEAIKRYLESKGIIKSRSTVRHGRLMIEQYYNSFDFFKPMYKTFFRDKKREYKRKNRNMKRFEKLIKDLGKSEMDEIHELIQLRVKSWSWKNKDKCTIVEGASPFQDAF